MVSLKAIQNLLLHFDLIFNPGIITRCYSNSINCKYDFAICRYEWTESNKSNNFTLFWETSII